MKLELPNIGCAIQLTEEDLRRRNFGETCLVELEEWLVEKGLKLGMSLPEPLQRIFPVPQNTRIGGGTGSGK